MTATTGQPAPATSVRYRTAAHWLHDLGDIALERIVFDPWPGTATEADVIRLDDHEDRLCELINGTLVEKPMGYIESLVASALIEMLRSFVRTRKLGLVTGEAGMMRLMRGLVRIPNVAFISYDRLPNRRVPTDPIPSLAPDLVCEILSKSNTPGEIQRKLREYFEAGVSRVWIIDPVTRTAMVYTSPHLSTRIEPDGILSGSDALSGLDIKLADLFVDLPQ